MESLAKQAIRQIITATQTDENEDISLFRGFAGRLLFHWYAGNYGNTVIDVILFNKQLNKLLSLTPSVANDISFGYGATGIAWLMELILSEQNDHYTSAFNQNYEDKLASILSSKLNWNGEIEHVLGLSGIMPFASRRKLINKNSNLANIILNHFNILAIHSSDECITWCQPANSKFRFQPNPEIKEINLGLAHGVPSIMSALITVINLEEKNDLACFLLEKSCNWLIQQSLNSDFKSIYSCFVGQRQSASLGWCYGDLGIAIVLARAGIALGNINFIKSAIKIGIHAAMRNTESAMVRDAGLCHGSSGLFIQFNRLNDLVPRVEFAKAAKYWMDHTLKLFKNRGVEGFYAFRNGKYIEDLSLLYGLSGVGLSLLVGEGVKPKWLDVLNLS